jgi:hypothetical protein
MTFTPMLAHGGPLLFMMGVAGVCGSMFIGGICAVVSRHRQMGAWLILSSVLLFVFAIVWHKTIGSKYF